MFSIRVAEWPPIYYGVGPLECSFLQGSDKIVIVICKLASNSKRK